MSSSSRAGSTYDIHEGWANEQLEDGFRIRDYQPSRFKDIRLASFISQAAGLRRLVEQANEGDDRERIYSTRKTWYEYVLMGRPLDAAPTEDALLRIDFETDENVPEMEIRAQRDYDSLVVTMESGLNVLKPVKLYCAPPHRRSLVEDNHLRCDLNVTKILPSVSI